ncbi:hypothetical protein PGTUg99_009575 [Puccinia graminis f. sp. tritici]|uniref:Uncharacterized protein n=1 Tax=Puccinia graminis f. sp. tritici TaxID=56615 RepID=A0A5B0LHJ8_PUCGR|nr:hypothetical protein PGTUg99_009575 [Puccinia graminis f. sp. tritici]
MGEVTDGSTAGITAHRQVRQNLRPARCRTGLSEQSPSGPSSARIGGSNFLSTHHVRELFGKAGRRTCRTCRSEQLVPAV